MSTKCNPLNLNLNSLLVTRQMTLFHLTAKPGFTGVYIFFVIFYLKHRLWTGPECEVCLFDMEKCPVC